MAVSVVLGNLRSEGCACTPSCIAVRKRTLQRSISGLKRVRLGKVTWQSLSQGQLRYLRGGEALA